MPFWWYRRRKPWFGRYKRKRFTYRKRKPRRRLYRRRRTRRTRGRRRRRRYKVRRKQKKITIKQWQPESIRKCKIKGLGPLVIGAEGTQYRCFTVYKYEWTNPKTAGGGGFGCELFTLQYLYNEYKAKNNIWTASNLYKDFGRYTGCEFTFYRHEHTDFIITYDLNPPFTINKYTYMMLHPVNLLQSRHKKILLSKDTKPNGKLTKKLKIRPPKLMSTKWFFQEELAKYGLVTIAATACNFRFPWMACCNENLIITLDYLQPGFYKHSEWAQASTAAYNPLGHSGGSQMSTSLYYYYYDDRGAEQNWQMQPFSTGNPYTASLNYDTGWFNTKVLRAFLVSKQSSKREPMSITPCGTVRYNPILDTGEKNKIYVVSTLLYNWQVPKDEDLIIEGYPLWMAFHGFTSFLKQIKSKTTPFKGSMIVVQSPALYRVRGEDPTNFYPILDRSFIKGRGTNNTDPIKFPGSEWYPSIFSQRDSISQIVNCGPYIPKYNETKESTWQLNYFYKFYFKWGGSYPPDQPAENPQTKSTYDIPDKMQQAIEIADPINQQYHSVLKPWDFRRGEITKKAFKRMFEHLEVTDSVSTDSSDCSSPKKKRKAPLLQDPKEENKKIQACLLSLCEEPTCPDQKEENLHLLIQQQHQQQQQIKYNLLQLISDLKAKQRTLLHNTGLLN
nr:MAG: ORF1 [Torque teno midi virus]